MDATETLAQAAARLGINRLHLDNWRRLRGVVPVGTINTGKKNQASLYRIEDIDKLAAKYMRPAGLVTVRELAEQSGRSIRSVSKLVYDGLIPSVTRGRTHYLKPDALSTLPAPRPRSERFFNTQRARPRPHIEDDFEDDDGYGHEVSLCGVTVYATDVEYLHRVRINREVTTCSS